MKMIFVQKSHANLRHDQTPRLRAGIGAGLLLLAMLLLITDTADARGLRQSFVWSWPVLRLVQIDRLSTPQPVYITHAGDGSGRLFVVEKQGRIRVARDGAYLNSHFLDIRERVNWGDPDVDVSCGECGMLSVAFPPDFEQSQVFYVYYNSLTSQIAPTDPNEPDRRNDSIIARFRVSENDPDVADPNSEERVLLVNQPYANHNGGLLAFGPDGYLYLGLGDGGSGGDPLNSGQRTDTLLGKILRIDVSDSGAYTIPADNPFATSDSARPEIWSYGWRNPWRFSFDRLTGDMYIGDVGQRNWEEINFEPASDPGGRNYGWNTLEGTHCYNADSCDMDGLTLPVAEYEHAGGRHSIVGGVVYRGPDPDINGLYLYADTYSREIFGLRRNNGVWESQVLHVQNLPSSGNFVSFGEDEAGRVYIADLDGRVFEVIDPTTPLPPRSFLPMVNQTN